ncbi:Uncharacterised protein [Moraxella caviae]|uniref:Uncharacterized protein n=1 Tax=Moraxella caviae TaxID=34060 RepID=A0A378R8J5_9GAMM|nr:hypothetical protein [Moraxella caviae]STZ13682.1 Uncharacterised protein [Moraxella caviae]
MTNSSVFGFSVYAVMFFALFFVALKSCDAEYENQRAYISQYKQELMQVSE